MISRATCLKIFYSLCPLILLMFVLQGCNASQNVPPELQRGIQALKRQLAPMQLKRSMFYAAYPNGKPTDYVNYLFSSLGASEAPTELMNPEIFPEEQAGSKNEPPPLGIALRSGQIDPDDTGYQILLSGDDTKGIITIKGYLPVKPGVTTPEPVTVEEVPLVKVTPDPIAQQFYQSSIEMGASDGSR